MLGETPVIDVYEYRQIYKYDGISGISTVGRCIDQHLGGSIWDYVCNAELIGPWVVQGLASNMGMDWHPN